jgi:hypothetical protein
MKGKSKKRVVPYLNYNVKSFNDYQYISDLSETKALIFKNLIEAIEDGIEKNKKEASIFMVDYDHYVSLNKNSWKSSLTAAIRYYSNSEKEEYEMCQKCVDLINRIDKRELKLNNHEQGV